MNRFKLLQLLSDNRRPFTPIEARVKAEGGAAAIYLYDPIVGDRLSAEWWGGICPQDFVPALRSLDAEKITIYTNCPGGDVFAAEAMCQALREHPAKITMQIEGYAASAATSVACACDEVVATKASKYMIHQTWTFAMGNAEDLRGMVDLLDKCDDAMYDAYAKKTGVDRERIVDWCKSETWFTAGQAKEHGFIDSVIEAAPKASARALNLSAYANGPKFTAPEPEQTQEPIFINDDRRARIAQRVNVASRI